MKKILLSLLFVVAGIAAMSAGTYNFDCTAINFEGVADKANTITGKSGNFTITINKENGATAPTQNATTKDIRAYALNTVKVSSTENMTSCVFNISVAGMKRLATSSVDNGALSYNVDAKTVTWTGSGTSFTITVGATSDLGSDSGKAGQLDFNSLDITTGIATSVASPTFSPKGGTYYEAQTVTLSCSTPGATIKYSIDGGDVTTYSQPLTINKTSTVMAMASKSGLQDSEIAEETYTISSIPTVANIAAYLALDKDAIAKITGNVTVIFQNGRYLFVKDNSGALQIYGDITNTYQNGDVLSGIVGTVGEYGGLKQMAPTASSFGTATQGTAVTPTVITANQATASMSNQLVKIFNASITIPDPAKAKNFNVTDATGTLAGYNRFTGVTIPTDTKKYDVLGIINQYNATTQIFVIEFSEYNGVNGVDADATTSIVPSFGTIDINAAQAAQATVVNAAGQVVAQKMITEGNNTINVAPGFYIVKVGTTVAKVIVK